MSDIFQWDFTIENWYIQQKVSSKYSCQETRRYTSKQMQSEYMYTNIYRCIVRVSPRIQVPWVQILPEADNFSLSHLALFGSLSPHIS